MGFLNFFKLGSSAERTGQQFPNVEALQGVECVYWQKAVIEHAKVIEIKTDRWGITVTFCSLGTPGFSGGLNAKGTTWTASASWSVFWSLEESWLTGYAGWAAHFCPDLIESLRTAAEGVAGADRLVRYQTLVDSLNRYLRSHWGRDLNKGQRMIIPKSTPNKRLQ